MHTRIESRTVSTTHTVVEIQCATADEYTEVAQGLERDGFHFAQGACTSTGLLSREHYLSRGCDLVIVFDDSREDRFGDSFSGYFVRKPTPLPLPSILTRPYEERIAALLSGSNLPPPNEPTREDHIRTLLVGGYDAIEKRDGLSREAFVAAPARLRNFREALAVAREAEERGIRLREEYTVARLSAEVQRLEAAERQAMEDFEAEDHRLCCTDYNAWRIANK